MAKITILKLTKEQFLKQFNAEMLRRTMLEPVEYEDSMDNFWEWYQKGETIDEIITGHIEAYDLTDFGKKPVWGVYD